MRRTALPAALALAAATPTAAEARPDGLLGPWSTTSYCLHGTMADGTYTRRRSAAVLPGWLRLGTRIRIVGRPAGPNGMRRYVIRDHIGHGSALDLWQPTCSGAIAFGRRAVRFKIGWRKPR